MLVHPTFAARFWAKVLRRGPDECWLWQAGLFTDGYGAVCADSRTFRAHRVAIALACCPDGSCWPPADILVLHTCDTPACCNPHHLYFGTHAQNMSDKARRGRSLRGALNPSRRHPERLARGANHVSRLYPERVPRGPRNGRATKPWRTARGERVARAVLRTHEVQAIRAAHLAGACTDAELARRYGVSGFAIWAVVTRRVWKHVP